MKIINRILLTSLIIFFGVNIISCDYLNVEDEFEDTMSYDSIFASKRNLERYMWGTASMFYDEGNLTAFSHTPGPYATDEGFTSFNTGKYQGIGYTVGAINADNLGNFNIWDNMYKVIRRCNLILSRMNEVKDMTSAESTEILGYTRFMRAYAYYMMLNNFGPLIIVGDKVYENNETQGYYNEHRSTYDETVDYICNEMEEAARYMPPTVARNYFGRPSKWAAYALIARMRLEQASPLYNGGDVGRRVFGDWVRSVDGVNYVSQQYDETKWAVAAAAAKRIIETSNNIFKLHTVPRDESTPSYPVGITETEDFPNGIGGIDHFRSYSDMFTGETPGATNPEYIWGRMSEGIMSDTKNAFNVDVLGGWNGLCITQKVVDAYRMVDGKDINESTNNYPYMEEGMDNSGRKIFSGYILNNNISNMYANREMRFYASVGFSRRLWRCTSTSETAKKDFTAMYYADGNSGRYMGGSNANENYASTGYVITKFIHENDAWSGTGATRTPKAFGIIRYAEILLIYAEALNHLTTAYDIQLGTDQSPYRTTVDRNLDEIKNSFNQIRYRAGLPGITYNEIADLNTFQNLLERERFIEFLFENRRYYDVRRWGIYEQRDSEPVTGMDIESNEPEYYSRVTVSHPRVRNRIVHKRMYLVPLPKYEVRRVKDLDQNPGWGD